MLQESKYDIYDFMEDVFYFFYEFQRLAPHAFNKEIIRNFKENNTKIIDLILQMGLYDDLTPELIDSLENKTKNIMIKKMVKIWADDNFFLIDSNFNEYFYITAEALLSGKDETVKILSDQILNLFETGPPAQLFTVFLFAMRHCLYIFDLTNIKIIRGFMRLTEQSEDTDDSEMYYCSDIRKRLFDLGSNKGELIFYNISQILKENKLEDLKTLIKLRWIEILNLKQLEILLSDEKINLSEKLSTLITKLLIDEKSEFFIFEDYVGLLYNINQIGKGEHFIRIFKNLRSRIKDFIGKLNEIIRDESVLYDKRIKFYAEELILLFNNAI